MDGRRVSERGDTERGTDWEDGLAVEHEDADAPWVGGREWGGGGHGACECGN